MRIFDSSSALLYRKQLDSSTVAWIMDYIQKIGKKKKLVKLKARMVGQLHTCPNEIALSLFMFLFQSSLEILR